MNQTKGRCQETSSFTIVHLLHRTAHVQLHGATQCTLDRGLEPKDSCQRKTIQRRAQTNDKQTAAEFYRIEREREDEGEFKVSC